MFYLEALLGSYRYSIQKSETKAPVDDVGSVVKLFLHILRLINTRVVSDAEVLQPGQVSQVTHVSQLSHTVVTHGEGGQTARQHVVTLAANIKISIC